MINDYENENPIKKTQQIEEVPIGQTENNLSFIMIIIITYLNPSN